MTGQRKSAAERSREEEDMGCRAWEDFKQRLDAVENYVQALQLTAKSLSPADPGRTYYSNLGFFMASFSPPGGASVAELTAYRRLLAKFDAEGAIAGGHFAHLDSALSDAIGVRHH